jgi:hypothetical protein
MHPPEEQKFFWFFFSKKNRFSQRLAGWRKPSKTRTFPIPATLATLKYESVAKKTGLPFGRVS